jgi:hypothetical protein
LEERLLINCLLLSLKKGVLQEAHDGQVDWNSFIQQSSRHGLSGLIYFYLRQERFKDSFPPRVTDFLKKEYYRNVVQNMVLLKELQRILTALHDKGTEALLFQGAALLLVQIYPSLGARPLIDLDFLIEPAQQEVVRQALRELGYSSLPLYPNLLSSKGVWLDVHTDVANLERIQARRYAISVSNDRLWQEARPQRGPWGQAYTLSAEDLVITSAAHLQKHSYSRLIWFVDIMNIMEHYGERLDRPKMVSRAREFNLQKPLYFSLMFLQEVFDYRPASELTGDLLDEELGLVEERLLSALLTGAKLDRVGDFLYMCSIKTITRKLLFLKETVFPKREVMMQVFGFSNPLAIGFCYLVRFFQSLGHGFRLLFSSLWSLNNRLGTRQ